jgi:hypothetical protein
VLAPRDRRPTNQNEPLVETNPDNNASSNLTERSLRQRIRQQEILAELGVFALQGAPVLDLLNHTARLTAEGLEANSARCWSIVQRKIGFSCVPGRVGWEEGIVGSASVGADLRVACQLCLAHRKAGYPIILKTRNGSGLRSSSSNAAFAEP